MKVKLYNLISDLVEKGAERGWKRAFKHSDSPNDAQIVSSIHKYVMEELCEYINFEED